MVGKIKYGSCHVNDAIAIGLTVKQDVADCFVTKFDV